MADVFISYAHQDGDVVKELSPELEAAGYTTWYYEDKGAIGASYLRQIDQEIEQKIGVYLRGTQAEHGGWPLYHGGDFNLSASVKAYFALKLAGHSPDRPLGHAGPFL